MLRKLRWALPLLLLLLAPMARAEEPVVRAVFFGAETCPHCHIVNDETLVPLQARYGNQLQIVKVEVSEPAGYEVWTAAMEARRVPANQRGVPMLVIGDRVLVGSRDIPNQLPGLIEQYLAAGGLDYPAIPGLQALLAATPALTPEPTPAPVDSPAIHLAYFYQPGCSECDRVTLDLNYLRGRYAGLVVHEFNVQAEAALSEWLGARAGVPEAKRLIAPAVFVAGEALVDQEITGRSLEALVARYATSGAEPSWADWEQERESVTGSILERFRSFGVLTVLVAGLVDGLNPCAFATIVFFISYLAVMGRRRVELLLVGAAFALGVFITYLGVGLGFLRFLVALPFLAAISRWIYALAALLCVVLAGASLYDWWQARRGRPEDMRLKLPRRLRRWINRVIRQGAGMRAFVPVAFVTGMVISIIELACTGQVYLPTILFVLSVPELKARATLYLVMYNLMFILPLVVVFVLAYLGTTSEQLGQFINRRAAAVKLASAGLFLLLAGWLIVSLL